MSKSIFNLENKVVVITGAAGIQGPEHLKAFESVGAKVVATDIKNTKIILDVTNPESIQLAVKKIIGEYGRIDVLVNNAGATGKSATDWDQIIKVNLTGTYNCCQIIGATMKQGAIINISSISGMLPLTGIPLPFVSYGGTSLVVLLTACGIVYSIQRTSS